MTNQSPADDGARPPDGGALPIAFWATGLAGLWIATRGYPGLYHDARLYAAQALHRLDPERLQDDLLFRYGTQDAYTLFSRLHAPLVGALGLDTGTQVLLAFSHLLWLGALMFLAVSLFPDWRKYLFSVVALALPAGYSHLVLGYGEAFLTPRPLAEGLVMIGLALCLRRRMAWGGAGLLLATLFHPLMALAGWGAATLLMLARHPRRLLWILPSALLLPLLGWAASIPPFEGLLRPMDAQWAAFVQQYNPVIFLSQWDARDISIFSVDSAVCLAALLLCSRRSRLFIAAALATGLAGVLVNLVAADLLHLQLFVQAQFSRLLWIAHLAAALSWSVLAAPLLARLPAIRTLRGTWREERHPEQALATRYSILGLAWMSTALLLAHAQMPAVVAWEVSQLEAPAPSVSGQASATFGFPPLAPLFAVLGLLFVWQSLGARRPPDQPLSLPSGGFLGKRLFGLLMIPPSAALLTALPALWFWLQGRLNAAASLQIPSWNSLGWVLIAPLAVLLLVWAWRLWMQGPRAAAWGLVLLLLAASLLLRDRRAPQVKRWEAADFQLFSGLSSRDLEGSHIYWDDAHNLALWYGLETPCYLTWTHRAVAPFFRAAAMEWQRRLEHVLPLWETPGALLNKSVAPLPASRVQVACRDPELDAVILAQPHPVARAFEFDGRRFYLYNCR